MIRYCELCEKQVINIADCCCLGNVVDLELDECNGRICALVVAAPGKFFCIFCPACEYINPRKRVVRIGPDIILVDVCVEDVKS